MHKVAFRSTMEGVPWGGSELLWSDTALRLQGRADVDVFVSVLKWDTRPASIAKLEEAGAAFEWREYRAVTRKERILRRLKLAKPKLTWIESTQPDLVVVSLGHHLEGLETFEECIERGVPYVVVVQSAVELLWPSDAMRPRHIRAYENAVATYFVSQGNLDLVRTMLATPLRNARIIRNPFTVSYSSNPNWPAEDVFRLACVGRLEPAAKGQDLLLEVLDRPKWRERSLEVSLIGGGLCVGGLTALRDVYGLDSVKIPGYSTDIAAIWERHHALIMSSRFEGLPIALVEAMLCNRVCIVTDVAGNAELLEDGISGFIAPFCSVDAIDETLERAWQRRAEWRKMGQAAGESARAAVSPDPIGVFADELLAIVKKQPTSMPLAAVRAPFDRIAQAAGDPG